MNGDDNALAGVCIEKLIANSKKGIIFMRNYGQFVDEKHGYDVMKGILEKKLGRELTVLEDKNIK